MVGGVAFSSGLLPQMVHRAPSPSREALYTDVGLKGESQLGLHA